MEHPKARAAQFGAPLGPANQCAPTIPETRLSKKLRAKRRTLSCTSPVQGPGARGTGADSAGEVHGG